MKCVLHIGTEKTGTTLLQNWLYANRDQLSKEGIYLSDILGKTNNRVAAAYFSSVYDDFYRQNKIYTPQDKEAFFADFVPKFEADVNAASSDHDTFLITSEHFHSRVIEHSDILRLRDFLMANFTEVKIISYFRPQFDTIVSLYSTGLKSEVSSTLEDFITLRAKSDDYYVNYLKIADNWSEAFGLQCCDFRIYDRKMFNGGDIRRDFLKALNPALPDSNFDFAIDSANESLSLYQAIAYRKINATLPYWKEDGSGVNGKNKTLKKEILALETLKDGKITSNRRFAVEEIFKDSNELFFKKYFNCENLFITKDQAASTQSDAPASDKLAIIDELIGYAIHGDTVLPKGEAVDRLRNIALRAYNNQRLNKADALFLMKLAQSGRPHGKLINEKVKEWEAER
ncbi:hypothetical protein [Thioclava sp. GXIMD2076]|uniref:hypothetical protein n=1 Tax=Thioclava sp. GXIMD2076 TaxID=3131931 RepID=UPI0030D33FB7